MKSNRIVKHIINFFLVTAIPFSILTSSCHEVTDVKRPEKLIPDKAMVGIITETSLADGLLTIPEVRDKFTNKDSLSVYARIVKRYGYEWEDMNNTMNFYFTRDQNRFLKIYDKVLARLTELQLMINNEPIPDAIPESDLWKGPRTIFFPDPLAPGNGEFSIKVNPPGYYTISFNMTVYPGDQSKNPCASIWLVKADSADTAKKKYLDTNEYFPDGATRTYSISGKIDSSDPILIEGILFDRENKLEDGEKHARLDKIYFTFTRQAL